MTQALNRPPKRGNSSKLHAMTSPTRFFAALLIAAQTGCADTPPPKRIRMYVGDHQACHQLTIWSQPPGAYVYGPDNAFWGVTDKSQPLRRTLIHELYWDPHDETWAPVYTYSLSLTITLKKPGYKVTKHTFPFSSYFLAFNRPREELVATQRLALCPSNAPTTNVVVVLDTAE